MTALDHDPLFKYALERIERDYGHKCVLNRKDLNKFGGNPAVGTSEISLNSWGQNEVFQTSNVVLNISSTSAADAGKEIVIEYMDLTDDRFTFGVMEVALDGSDGRVTVPLPTAAARWTRMVADEDMVGDVYCYRDAAVNGTPSDLTKIHIHIPAGANQSQKAGTTIAHSNYFLITDVWACIVKKASEVAILNFKVREYGGVFRTSPRRGVSSNDRLEQTYRSPRIILPGSDIIMTASVSSGTADMAGGFNGLFADIEGWGRIA